MTPTAHHEVKHPGGFVANPVIIEGEGRPLVYLHGCFGIEWGSFLDTLAGQRRVYAPAHAGSIDFDDLDKLDTLWDLVLYYDDLFEELGLDEFDLVGHSFGGMVAAEFAAAHLRRIGKLVLIDPFGLWNDAEPVGDHLLAPAKAQLAMRFHDVTKPDVAAQLAAPADPEEQIRRQVRTYTTLGSTSHFMHPIPERGLHRRLRRIKVPTLVIWGQQDGLIPVSYADAFGAAIPDARTRIIADAGHSPQLEQPEAVTAAVTEFLA